MWAALTFASSGPLFQEVPHPRALPKTKRFFQVFFFSCYVFHPNLDEPWKDG
jgi:hypothetical protein